MALRSCLEPLNGYSAPCSKTIRTARSRNSVEYLLGRPLGSILSRNEPSDKPGTVQTAFSDAHYTLKLSTLFGRHFHYHGAVGGTPMSTIKMTVNGVSRSVDIDDLTTPLLYVLRNDLGLEAPKFGCGLGQC